MSVADIISEDIIFEVSHSILQVSKTISSVIIIVLQYIFFIRNAVNLRILPCIIIPSFCFNVKITIITTNLNASTKQKYSLQGTTQGRYLTGGVPPVRFSM